MDRENLNFWIKEKTGFLGVPAELMKYPSMRDYVDRVLHPVNDDDEEANLELIVDRINDWKAGSTQRRPEGESEAASYFIAPDNEWEYLEALGEHLAYHITRLPQVKEYQDKIRVVHPENRLLTTAEVHPFLASPACQFFTFDQLRQWNAFPILAECVVLESRTVLVPSTKADGQMEAKPSVPFQRIQVRFGADGPTETVEHDWQNHIILAKPSSVSNTSPARFVVCPHRSEDTKQVSGFIGTVVGDALDLGQGITEFCLDEIWNALMVLLTGQFPPIRPVTSSVHDFFIPDIREGSGFIQGPLRLVIQPGVSPETLHQAYSNYYWWARSRTALPNKEDIRLLHFIRENRWPEPEGRPMTWADLLDRWESEPPPKQERTSSLRGQGPKDPWRNFRTRYQRARKKLIPDGYSPGNILSPEEVAYELQSLATATWNYQEWVGTPSPPRQSPRTMPDVSDAQARMKLVFDLLESRATAYQHFENGETEAAIRSLQYPVKSQQELEQRGFSQGILFYDDVLLDLVWFHYNDGQISQARAYLTEWKRRYGNKQDQVIGGLRIKLPGFVKLAFDHSDYLKAATLLACLNRLAATPDNEMSQDEMECCRKATTEVKEKIGVQEFNKAWKRGKRMPLGDILDVAIADASVEEY